jgi:archaellum component FlaC
MDNFLIKQIDNLNELHNCVKVIQQSFITVAQQFNLTKENAPSNAAFISFEDLTKMKENFLSILSKRIVKLSLC